MSLEQLLHQIDQLTGDELRQLQEHIERRRREAAEERVRAFDEVVAALREGLTEQEIEEIIAAINAEYIEPFDDSQWRD